MYNTFLDEIVEKAREAAKLASRKTGEAVEISKYKLESIHISNEVKKLYEQLGASVYSMVKGGYDNPELVEGLTEEIDALLLHLDAVAEKISEMRSVTRCPACGAKNSLENCYCCRCGARLRNEFTDPVEDDLEEEFDGESVVSQGDGSEYL